MFVVFVRNTRLSRTIRLSVNLCLEMGGSLGGCEYGCCVVVALVQELLLLFCSVLFCYMSMSGLDVAYNVNGAEYVSWRVSIKTCRVIILKKNL